RCATYYNANPRYTDSDRHEDVYPDIIGKIRVHADPAERHEEHQRARQVRAAATERRAAEHHLIDARLVAHHREGGEDRAADDVADHDDRDGLEQPELEHDAERAERPVDRRNVGPGPHPHLLAAGR